MQTPVIPLLARQARLGLIHAGETTLKFRLTKSPVSINLLTLMADLAAVEADFDDYPAGGAAVTYTTGPVTADGIPFNESGAISIICATTVVTNNCPNWWVDNGTHIVMAGTFNNAQGVQTPIPFDRVGGGLICVLRDSYPPAMDLVQVYP